jgi:hypothetical protein
MFAKFCLIAHQKKRFLFNTRQEGQYRTGPNITEAEGQDRKMETSGKNRIVQRPNSWTYFGSLQSFPPFYSQLHLLTDCNVPHPPLSKRGLKKLVGNENILYGNLKSENSQDYVQTPQRNCMFMNFFGFSTTIGPNQEI